MAQDRVTVVEKVYYEPSDSQPFQIDNGFDFNLETTEQVYQRKSKATTHWSAVDTGWLGENVSMLIIENTEGRSPVQKIPSAAEKAALRSRFLLVTLGELDTPLDAPLGCFPVYPGQGLRLPILNAAKVILRCPNGIAKYTVTAIPR